MNGENMSELKKEIHGTFRINVAQLIALVGIFIGIITNTGIVTWYAASQNAKTELALSIGSENKAQIKIVADAQSQTSKDNAEMKGTLNYLTNVVDNINQVVMSRKR